MPVHLKLIFGKTITGWQAFSCFVLSDENVGVEQSKLESFINNYYRNQFLDLRVKVGVNSCKN